jgi:hypothetical protein
MADTGTRSMIIRDVTEAELRIYKASAALSGLSLQAWCLQVLRDRIQAQSQSGGTLTYTVAPVLSPGEGDTATRTTQAPAATP